MNPTIDTTVDLRHYWRMIWRRREIIILCAVASVCAAAIVLALTPEEYESRATIMIEDSRLLSNEIEKVIGGLAQAPNRYGIEEERMARLVGRVRSRPFLERVVRTLQMEQDPVVRAEAAKLQAADPQLTIDEVAVRMLVSNLKSRINFERAGPGLYRIIVSAYSAENARTLARCISEQYVEISSESSLDRIRAAHEFGSEQAQIYERQLHEAEGALEAYQRTMIDRSLSRRLISTENLPRAEALHGRLLDEVQGARARLQAVADSARGGSARISASGSARIRDLQASFASTLKDDVRRRLSSTSASGTESMWPPLGTYAAFRSLLQQELRQIPPSPAGRPGAEDAGMAVRLAGAQIELEVLQEAAGMLGGSIGEFRRQAQSSPEQELELARLERNVENSRKLLESFRSQQVASDVSRAVEVTDVGLRIEILDPAALPMGPSRPNRPKVLAASLFLGPLLGACLAFVTENLDPTLRTLDDFARIMPEPVLGTTPLISRPPSQRPWIRRHWAPAAAAGVVLLTGALFAARSTLVQQLAGSARPVQMSAPGAAPEAGR